MLRSQLSGNAAAGGRARESSSAAGSRGGPRAVGGENQENVNPKFLAGAAAAPPPARTVLGVLQNSHSGRLQRGASKQQQAASVQEFSSIKNENSDRDCVRKTGGKPSAFTIHVDEPDGGSCKGQNVPKKVEPKENLLALNPAITSLRNRLPLAPIECPMDLSYDSPMVLDVLPSCELERKQVNANEVPDYAEDIYKYLRELEVKCKPKAGYMKKQPDITHSMRAILIDWLVEVGEEYKLQNETLYLAVNYIDRFLSSMSVLRGKLQLVGTAAMLLASKFEEIYPPEVSEFVFITDDTYTKKQVLRMEHLILKVLSFDLAAPTINQFLTQYLMHQKNPRVESLSMYLGELTLIDADPYLIHPPSIIAAAAFIIANYVIVGETWPECLAQLTGYSMEDLIGCLTDLHLTYLEAPQHAQQSIREKYKSTKYHGVSQLKPPENLAFFHCPL
ncbi:cyclin-A2 [Latimeria chalumnae]|uniref:cyclin-A2 n=1 Tax=Latimeria chalumnae TaxID=7897 RepID=UPI00313E6C44